MTIGRKEIEFPERKYFHAEIKADEEKTTKELGIFSGHANTFDLDEVDDIVEPGSFKKTIQEHGNTRALFFMHATHDVGNLMGTAAKLREDAKGLFTEGELMLKYREVEKAFDAIKGGIIDRMSIGFRVVKAIYEKVNEDKFVRRIKELKLMEISLIPKGMAANNQSLITDFKSNQLFEFIKQGNESKDFKLHILSLLFPGIEPDAAFTTLAKLQEPEPPSTPSVQEPKFLDKVATELKKLNVEV